MASEARVSCRHCGRESGSLDAIFAAAYSALLAALEDRDVVVRLDAAERILRNPPFFDLGDGQSPYIPSLDIVEVA